MFLLFLCSVLRSWNLFASRSSLWWAWFTKTWLGGDAGEARTWAISNVAISTRADVWGVRLNWPRPNLYSLCGLLFRTFLRQCSVSTRKLLSSCVKIWCRACIDGGSCANGKSVWYIHDWIPFHCWRNWHESLVSFVFLLVFIVDLDLACCCFISIQSPGARKVRLRIGRHKHLGARHAHPGRCDVVLLDVLIGVRKAPLALHFVCVCSVCVCVRVRDCMCHCAGVYLSTYLPIFLSIYRSICLFVVLAVVQKKAMAEGPIDRKL